MELRMGLLSGKIRETKNNNRRKLEQKLQQNSREVWSVIKGITGFRPSNRREAAGGQSQ